jgi:arylsulfatase A-like enzyme
VISANDGTLFKESPMRHGINRALCLACILALTIAKVAAATERSADKRPNIVFIMADDHAEQAISAYGSRINRTPNLDRLAREGMRFTNCFVTNSICGPSRAVILTGKYSHLNGMIRNEMPFDGGQQNVAKLLRHAGYQTAVIGKWHLMSNPTGFDHWHILIGQGPYYNPTMLDNGKKVRHTGYTTEVITDLVLDWLKTGRDPSKPFFLMYHHKAPHRDWQPGPKQLLLFKDKAIREPETLFDDYAGRGTAARTQEMTVAHHLTPADLKLVEPKGLTPDQLETWRKAYDAENAAFRKANLKGKELIRWKYQRYIKDYLRCVASLDENVGRVLDFLDRAGLRDNTVVIYTSDQGFYLGEHGWYDKRWMYEESLRTPLLIRFPGVVRPGTTVDQMVLNLDLPETFLEIAGAVIPTDMQGRSLAPFLQGKTPTDWRRAIYYRYYEYPGPHSVRQHYGVRTERYKLIYFPDLREWELYDLVDDPREMRNVYDEPSRSDTVRELKAELARLQTQYQDKIEELQEKP